MFEISMTLKQWFLNYKFMWCYIMMKNVLEEFAKELKLTKVVAISR